MHSEARKVGDTVIRHALRTQTQQVHEELHRHASFDGLLKGSLDLAGYRELLKRLYGFYQPLDEAVTRVLTTSQGNRSAYSYVGRSALLERDLLDLGFTGPAIRNLPVCGPAHQIVSPRTIGGVLYVVEGATRGGSLINKAAERLLGTEFRGGRSYWSWCKSAQNSQWVKINAYLDLLCKEGAEPEDLVSGAAATFRLFSDWLLPLDRPMPAESSVA